MPCTSWNSSSTSSLTEPNTTGTSAGAYSWEHQGEGSIAGVNHLDVAHATFVVNFLGFEEALRKSTEFLVELSAFSCIGVTRRAQHLEAFCE